MPRLGPPYCDRKGGCQNRERTRGRNAKAASPHTPPRSKAKRVQKTDGYKNLAKRRKSGVQRSRERWGREPPRNPRCKEAVERGRWPIKAPPTNGESHTTVGPASGSWGGDGQLGWGGKQAKNWGAQRRRLCSSAVRGARSLRTVFIFCDSEGVRPLPTHSPGTPPLRCSPGRPHTYVNLEDWTRPLQGPLVLKGSSLTKTPGTVLKQGGTRGQRVRVDRMEEKITPREAQTERQADAYSKVRARGREFERRLR